MRGLLLWMARNKWLRDHLPKLWFARRAVRRFMPGEDPASALDAAVKFQADGIASEFTRLGENITTVEEGDAVVEHYLGLMDDIAARDLDGEVSVKLTQLGYDLDVERTLAHTRRLADKAAEHGKTLWVDMEGSAYAEGTVAFYERLKQTNANTGLCLQSYLHRTAADVQRLLPLDPAIRLVKGAYAEPATIAYQKREDVDSELRRAGGRAPGGRPRGSEGSPRARDPRRPADRADRRAHGGDGPAEDELRGPDAVRHPHGPAAPARGGGLPRSRPHRVRRGVVSVVHAAARRAPANVIFALRQIIG